MRDFLASLTARGAPTVIPAPPIGITHFANDPILNLSAVNRGAGVGEGFAWNAHFRAQFGGGFRRRESDLEFGPLVFLDSDLRSSGRTGLHIELHRAHQSITGRGETSRK